MRCSGSGCVRLGGGTSARGSVAAPTPLMAVGWAAALVLAMTVRASLTDVGGGCCDPAVPAARMLAWVNKDVHTVTPPSSAALSFCAASPASTPVCKVLFITFPRVNWNISDGAWLAHLPSRKDVSRALLTKAV